MTNPLETLLHADTERTAVARVLGSAHVDMTEAIEAYRKAWRAATSSGWAKADLVRAGFTDPSRLPRTSPRRSTATNTEE